MFRHRGAVLTVLLLCLACTHGIRYPDIIDTASHWLSGNHEAEIEGFLQGARSKFTAPDWAEEAERLLLSPRHNRSYALTHACLNSTLQLIESFKTMPGWLLKMLDSTTKIESGLLSGNLLWLGAFEQCQTVAAMQALSPNDTHEMMPLFGGMPCSVVINNVSAVQPVETTAEGLRMAVGGLSLGICIPDVCTPKDSMHLTNEVMYELPKDYQAISASCHKNEAYPLDTAAIGVIAMLSVIGFVLLFATFYDVFIIRQGVLSNNSAYIINDASVDNEASSAPTDDSTQYSKLDGKREAFAAAEGHRGMFAMLMIRLSAYSNAIKLLATERTQSSLDAINGIRFISLSWVILGHTYIFSIVFMDNLAVLPDVVKGFPFQAILNALVSVDTFFLLSGTLVSFLLLKELKKKDGPRNVNWLMFYFHRFWRLTPPYMIILGAHTVLFKYMGSGPFWSPDGIEPECPGSWWANLVYMNNVITGHTGCMGWTWYLADDMQFFVVSPIFIVALYSHKIVGIVVSLVALLGSTVAVAVITKINNYPPEAIGNFVGEPSGNWFNDVYITPWCRIGPYIIGILLGYLLFKTECKVRIKWYVSVIGWAVATATALAVLYGLYGVANGHLLSSTGNAIYSSLHRTAWAMAVAWVIFACLTGHGGPVNAILSWEIWIPLSRLTYMAYLIHPIVIYWFYLTRKTPLHFDQALMVYMFLGHLCISYALAFVCSLAFEAPMLGLEKVIFHRKKTTSQD